MDRLRHARWGFAVAFGVTAVFHALQAARGSTEDGSSPARHLLFGALNLFFAGCFAGDVRWVGAPLLLLAGQQFVSHGSDLVAAAQVGKVDAASLLVLAFLPVALAWSFWRWRARSPASGERRPSTSETGGR